MKAETVGDLVNWTRDMHDHLARSLQEHADEQSRTRSELLMRYLADHEAALRKMVGEFEGRAEFGTLGTWVYDYITENPVDTERLDNAAGDDLDVDEISADVFAVHRQLIDLYRYLHDRANSPEVRELVGELLELEENEAMRLARQVNHLTDI